MTPNLLGLFCVGFSGEAAPAYLAPWLADGLGGVILFRRNLTSLEQICRLTSDLHRAASHPLLLGVDQEGGRIARLPPPFLTPPAAAEVGRTGNPILAQALARAMGQELRAAGINWNLAPVLDVHTNPANPVIGDRAYGTDPETVTRFGLAVIAGLAEAGVLSTAKHFPGHGDTALDSHLTLPESPQPAERWRAVEFVPFRAAIRMGVPALMVAHLLCPALDPDRPASLSRVVITEILRGELGFDGVVVSDDLEMAAIAARFDIGEAAVRFLEAGGDLILICHDEVRQRAALAAVLSGLKSGRLSETRLQASLKRLAKLRTGLPEGGTRVTAESARTVVGCAAHRTLSQAIRPAKSQGEQIEPDA